MAKHTAILKLIIHQMHFIYLVVFWNDCHDDMNPDTFVVYVTVFLVIQLYLLTIIVIHSFPLLFLYMTSSISGRYVPCKDLRNDE